MTPHPRSPLAALFSAPGKFDFFQAVRLLERLAATERPHGTGGAEGRAAVGGDTAPEQEAVAFRVLPALRFPAGPVAKAAPAGAGPPELVVAFGGLTGPDGILPQHYTALLIARSRLKDHTLRDWLDMFHHRLLSLFTRAWEKNRWAAVVDRQRAEGADREDAATRAGLAVAGFGTGGLRDRLTLPGDLPVFYAGLLGRQPRTATGLEQVLGDFFGWSVRVEPFSGQWLYLDAENRAELPRAGGPGLNCTLGRDVVIGRRVWDVQGSVRVVAGPLGAGAFRSLLPGGDARGPLCELVRLYLGLEFDAEVQVLVEPDAVPVTALDYDERNGPRLGWNTWVRTHGFGAPVGDVRFAVG
jgi:type VI secretion system protein ImpH